MATHVQTDNDTVYAIQIQGFWYWVGDSPQELQECPSTDQCEACGGWAIERAGDHYVCADFEIDGTSWPGCGAVYWPKPKLARVVIFP